jgi:hypothetical protein
MTLAELQARIRTGTPDDLAMEFLDASDLAAFATPADYTRFVDRVKERFPDAQSAYVVGSGNWSFSLNPDKLFQSFHAKSDIDVAVLSPTLFQYFWDEMRRQHRQRFYLMSHDMRLQLRRNGENVYCGFITPLWIPNWEPSDRFEYNKKLNALSDVSVGFRKVKMMFFKNTIEMVDYYSRGFSVAKGALK